MWLGWWGWGVAANMGTSKAGHLAQMGSEGP